MAMSVGPGGGSLAEINVTPLVDVMLVLLIIFMVTAPMLETGVDLKLPQAKAKVLPDDSGKIVISINKRGEVLLDKMKLDPTKIEESLRTNVRLQNEKEAYLRADKDLKYGDVLRVMAAMQAAGVDKLGMITDPLE